MTNTVTKPRSSVGQQKVLILWLLQQSGPYENPAGRAVADLYAAYQSYGGNRAQPSFATMVASLERDEGCILREINGRRTFSIVLVDPKGYAEQIAALGDSKPKRTEVQVVEPTETVPSPVEEPTDVDTSGPTAADVASELLDQLVGILERPHQFESNQQSLREAREQAEGYRRKLVDTERDLVDVRRKLADATKKQLIGEANLAAVMRDRGASVRHDTVKALDRVMRQTPTGKGE